MALKTKIIVQQILNIDDTTTTASKYPKYTVVLGNSISSITAGELTAAVEASASSAAAAKDSEIAAKESETNAKDSENLAAIYTTSSETSATQSAASAAEAERQAGLSQKSAEASATSAEESKGFRDSAELAAQNAENSRRLAEQAKTAAQQAQVAAETAKTGAETAETNAGTFATTAGEHAEAAKQSELNAKTSETNAAASEGEAANQAVNATTEADRAKAEADRASQVVDGKLDKVDISGFIKVYKTKTEADADVSSRVLGEKILVWNQTDSKYGWYKVAGTVETPVLELVETEQKLVSINNVHADDAGNVQITLPGGNPSLWLGEVTWFPYDKDSGVGYPGVLPADGREVLRVDYPDTWEAIEAGLIPSVSEAEWQAGATLYFSTGDGSTTFRLPDMMQGQAFRAPTKGEEDAGVVKDQIPYITVINGVSPNDNGEVTLGNVVTKNVWDGISGEVLLRGAFGLGGSGITLNEPDLVSFFKAMRAFGSGYYRNDTAIGGLPAYSAGFYSKTADTHSFICPQYSSGIVFIGTINDNQLDGENPAIHTNVLYGTANKPDLNNDTEGTLSVNKGGTGASTYEGVRSNFNIQGVFCVTSEESGDFNSISSPNGKLNLLIANSKVWGVQDTEGNIAPLLVERGGTGATNISQARKNLGIGEDDIPVFKGVNLSLTNGANSGLLYLTNKNTEGVQRTYSSIYNELQSELSKTTIRSSNDVTGKTAFLQFDENGKLYTSSVEATGNIKTGSLNLNYGHTFTINSGEQNTLQISNYVAGIDTWCGYTKYNWYNDYAIAGLVRGGSTHVSDYRIEVYSPGVDAYSFQFFPQGKLRGASFNGRCTQGGWEMDLDENAHTIPFNARSIGNNNGGWVPIVSGGYATPSGYRIRAAFGAISPGTSGWGRGVIKLMGDNSYFRGFEFHPRGNLTTWANSPDNAWGTAFEFTKSPSSDRDLKKDIIYTDGKEAYDRVMQWLPTLFKYKGQTTQRYGFIAQDLMKVDPQYVKLVPGAPVFEDVIGLNEDGEEYVDRRIETGVEDDTLALDSNVMLVDLGAAVIYMNSQMEQQRKELEELKALVATLVNK
ncbi:tail fiber domain-containing protein [Salmonella enterica]|nr:tail fiber domain-containing protein [Salmonella enterica]